MTVRATGVRDTQAPESWISPVSTDYLIWIIRHVVRLNGSKRDCNGVNCVLLPRRDRQLGLSAPVRTAGSSRLTLAGSHARLRVAPERLSRHFVPRSGRGGRYGAPPDPTQEPHPFAGHQFGRVGPGGGVPCTCH